MSASIWATCETVSTSVVEANVVSYGASLDGITDDSFAVNAAIASLPLTGGTVVIPSSAAGMFIGTTIISDRPVHFRAGYITILGPTSGWIFDLTQNGCSFEGVGSHGTILKLNTPIAPVVLPTASTTIAANAIATAVINTAGANLFSTPVADVATSATFDSGALVPTIAVGVLSSLLIVAAGSGYTSAPAVTFKGGGAGAIKSNEIQTSLLKGFSVDLSSIPNAVGLLHSGGWYADWNDIDIIRTSCHSTSIGIVIDSHSLGVPGPTGSYGGVYVSSYSNILSNVVYIIGHDTSTATTLSFTTLDCTSVIIVAAVGVVFVNPVVQNGTFLFDLTNTDGIVLIGGDVEGTSTMFKTRGSCNNVKVHGTLNGGVGITILSGKYGIGWDLNLAHSADTLPPLRTGGGGTAGERYNNTGWTIQQNNAFHYIGDTFIYGTNLTVISGTQGNLFDTTLAGNALIQTAAGVTSIVVATAGANPRTLTTIARFASTSLQLPTIPTFADNAAATAGGVAVGYCYRTATGVMMVRY